MAGRGEGLIVLGRFFMEARREHRFSAPVTVFHDRPLPERATPAGYAALIDAYGLEVPLPRELSATAYCLW